MQKLTIIKFNGVEMDEKENYNKRNIIFNIIWLSHIYGKNIKIIENNFFLNKLFQRAATLYRNISYGEEKKDLQFIKIQNFMEKISLFKK